MLDVPKIIIIVESTCTPWVQTYDNSLIVQDGALFCIRGGVVLDGHLFCYRNIPSFEAPKWNNKYYFQEYLYFLTLKILCSNILVT